MLLVHEANPLYALPKSGKFTERFAKVGYKVSTAQVLDETAAACDLIIPNLHALERWDDLRPRAGVTGLLQPVTEPVFAAKHTGDVLLAVAKKVGGPLAAFTAAELRDLPQERRGPRRSSATPIDGLAHRARQWWRLRDGPGLGAADDARRWCACLEGADVRRGRCLHAAAVRLVDVLRRSWRQQAVAARESRSDDQDHLAVAGSRSIPTPPRRSTCARASSSSSPRRTAACARRCMSSRASTRTCSRCRSASGTPSTAATPRVAAPIRSTSSVRPTARVSSRTSPPRSR